MPAPLPPRPVRNNNPGDLIMNGTPWVGLLPRQMMTPAQAAEKEFCVFIDAPHGFRALGITLRTSVEKDGRNTPRKLITGFAPPFDPKTGRRINDTDAYIKNFCEGIGQDPDAVLDMNKRATLNDGCRLIAIQEAGGWLFETADLVAGVSMALAAKIT